MTTRTKKNNSLLAGLLTATAASLCCITPVLAFIGGASGLASSFSWIEPFRPYLIGLTVLVFAFAWFQKLKPQKHAECNCDTDNKPSFLQSKTFLSIVTVLAGLLIAFPYYAQAFYTKAHQPQVVATNRADIKQAEFKIKGMTCAGCTEHVNSEIAKLKGIIEYQTSYERAMSIVKFDQGRTSIDSIVKAINNTGYKVIAQAVTNN